MIVYEVNSWLGIIFNMRGSVLPRVLIPVTISVLIGVFAAWLHSYNQFSVSLVAHQLLSIALGFLLVFRTNLSYQRYWEGRTLLGGILKCARNLMRQCVCFLEDGPKTESELWEIRRLICIFYTLSRMHLRSEKDLNCLKDRVSKEEYAQLDGFPTPPLLVLPWLSFRFSSNHREGLLTEFRLWLLDKNITEITDLLLNADKIAKTPLPFPYAQLCKMLLCLYCFTVPFALVSVMKWLTPVLSAFLSLAFFGIETIGMELEDPFGYDPNDLPLDTIGDDVERDTLDCIQTKLSRSSRKAARGGLYDKSAFLHADPKPESKHITVGIEPQSQPSQIKELNELLSYSSSKPTPQPAASDPRQDLPTLQQTYSLNDITIDAYSPSVAHQGRPI